VGSEVTFYSGIPHKDRTADSTVATNLTISQPSKGKAEAVAKSLHYFLRV